MNILDMCMCLHNVVLSVAPSSVGGQHHGDLGGPPIPEFARKALSEAQPGQPSGPSKRKKAAAKAQAEDQTTKDSAQKVAAQAKAVYNAVSDTRFRGAEASNRHWEAAEEDPHAFAAAAAHGDNAAAGAPAKAEHSNRKRDGGEQESQAHKRPKQKGRAAGEGSQQQQRQLPERRPAAAAEAGAEGQPPAVKAEGQESDKGRGGGREGGAEGSAGILAAVEYLGDGATRGQQLGEVNLASYDSYMCVLLLSLCTDMHLTVSSLMISAMV
jgi:hypothetical protein